EPERDASDDSLPSSPEQDGEVLAQEQNPVQKRKGGRKPIYATSEERKQRNRQAQAAFRERRTEYIKQLETTIKHHEENLQTLQQSHRTAADECLMLRYKNSLLERILLEKGIDVQAELRAKTGSPNLHPVRIPPTTAPMPQTIQRSSVSKGHQPRRYITHPPAKADTTPQLNPQLPENVLPNPSPRSNPTPTASHFSSPATVPTRSPNFFPQGGSTISPSLGPLTQHPQQRHSQPPLRPNLIPMQPPQRPPISASYTSSSGVSSNSVASGPGGNGSVNSGKGIFPTQFQSHYDQLGKLSQQEYDAAVDMTDDDVHAMQPPPQPMTSQGSMNQFQQATALPNAEGNNGSNYTGMNNFFDPYDPMLDADPFGLSASMHFPTQFSYD
ncbi:hypothetical protein NA57DRAFT_10834, partial [Rhizodiscina lignyota]